MVAKYKVIENPTEEEILKRIGGSFRPNYSRDDIFPIRKIFPMWDLHCFSVREFLDDEANAVALGCNYEKGRSEVDNNNIGWVILESEDSPLKIDFSAKLLPKKRFPNGFRYDCQVYGYKNPVEITFDYEKSPVHQLAAYKAFGNFQDYSMKYANLFKANDYLNKVFNAKSFLEFCGIDPSSMEGGSYGYNGYNLYWTENKGITLQDSHGQKEKVFFKWTELAAALTDLLRVEIKTEIKQTPLF